jgi:hypothetical protein
MDNVLLLVGRFDCFADVKFVQQWHIVDSVIFDRQILLLLLLCENVSAG